MFSFWRVILTHTLTFARFKAKTWPACFVGVVPVVVRQVAVTYRFANKGSPELMSTLPPSNQNLYKFI